MSLSGKRVSMVLAAAILVLAVFSPFALAEAPMVATLDAVVTGSGALLKSLVLGSGGQPITESGFYYGTSRASLNQKVQAQNPDSPEYMLTSLVPGTTYYYQAYAVNASGESVGEVVSFKAGPTATARPTDQPNDIQGYLDKIMNEFGMQIHYKTKRPEWNDRVSYTLTTSDAETLTGLKLIYNALARYPNGFLGKLKLKYIALAGTITTKDGATATGVALGNTQQTMLLLQATTKESVVHHELFHTFEYAFGLRFADWDKANVISGLYDDDLNKNYDMVPPGFITRYALTIPEEDRADLFMYMMTDNLKDQLFDTAAHDKYLQDKIRRLNNTLETNLGRIAQNSVWSQSAASAAKAAPKVLKTVVPISGAKLYSGPDTQIFPAVMDAPATDLSVVQTGGRWLKVLYGNEAYYMLAAEASDSQNQNPTPPVNAENQPYVPSYQPEANAPPSYNINGVAERLLQNHGISVSVNNALSLYDDLVAGAVRDTRGAAALAAEYEALIESGEKVPGSVSDLVICRTLSVGGSPQGAAMDGSGTVLYLSQQASGRLKSVMEALVAQL